MTESSASAIPSPAPGVAVLLIIAAAAVLFRAAAWLNPSEYIAIPAALSIPLGVLGLVYLACGLWVWSRRRTALTRVFLVYTIGGCVHWGGTIGADGFVAGIVWLLVYVSATAMGDGAFLDLALRYPRHVGRSRGRTVLFYIPAIAALVSIGLAPLLPKPVIEGWLGVLIGVSFLMSIAGGVVFLMKMFRASSHERRRQSLAPIVAVLVVTSGISLVADAGSLPGHSDAWNLLFGIEPLVLAWALLRLQEKEPVKGMVK